MGGIEAFRKNKLDENHLFRDNSGQIGLLFFVNHVAEQPVERAKKAFHAARSFDLDPVEDRQI